MGRQQHRVLQPKTHIIHSYINKDWNLALALGEAIDNSFAPNKGGAQNIWIEFQKNAVLIWDDGRGMDNVDRAFVMGDSSSYKDSQDIGLFGVGLTNTAIWLGSELEVHTIRRGKYSTHKQNWDDILKVRRWPTVRGRPQHVSQVRSELIPKQIRDQGAGTFIKISKLRKQSGRAKLFRLDALLTKLGHLFRPGLRSGLKIHIRRSKDAWSQVNPYTPIHLTNTITKTITVDGKQVHIHAGIMDPTQVQYAKFFVGFMHRTIRSSHDFFKDKNSNNVYGEITLGSGWDKCFSPDKTQIVDGWENLVDAVYSTCSSLLDEAREWKEQLRFDELGLHFSNELMDALTSLRGPGDIPAQKAKKGGESGGEGGGKKKEKRKRKQPESTTVDPNQLGDEGRVHDDNGRRTKTGYYVINIRFCGKDQTQGFVHYQTMQPGILDVFLNKDHPVIAEASKSGATNVMMLRILVAQAFAILFCDPNKFSTEERALTFPGLCKSLSSEPDLDLDDSQVLYSAVFKHVLDAILKQPSVRSK